MLNRAPMLLLLASPALLGGSAGRQDLDAGHFLKALAGAEAQLKANPADAPAWAVKSQALAALVRMPEALEAARRALALQPSLAEGLLARAIAQAGVALQQRNLGSLSGVSRAMDDLRAATEADPSLAAAWETLGVGYQTLPGLLGGSTRKALACADRLERLDRVRGAVLRGTILSMDGRWREAEPQFRAALAAAPGNPDVVMAYLEALGSRETRAALGDAEQRNREAQQAHALLPGVRTRARGLAAVCDALLDAGQGEEAWRIAREGLAGCDAPSLMHLQLGKISARSGVHREEGLAFLDQAAKEPLEGGSGGMATVHWRRGQILRDLGRKAEAQAAANEALRIDPRDNKARSLLKELS